MMIFPRLKLGRSAFLLALLAMPVAGYAQAPAAPETAAAKAVAPAEKAAPPARAPGAAQTDSAAKAAVPAPGTAPAPGGDEAVEAADRAIERMKSRIKEFEARTDIAPDIRDQALALLRTALGHLEATSASAASAKRFQESAQRSAERSQTEFTDKTLRDLRLF